MPTTANSRYLRGERAPRFAQKKPSPKSMSNWIKGVGIVGAVLLASLAMGSAMDWVGYPSSMNVQEGIATLESDVPLPPIKN